MVKVGQSDNLDSNILKNSSRIYPQPGPQEEFLKTTSDICLYGGAAGSVFEGEFWQMFKKYYMW